MGDAARGPMVGRVQPGREVVLARERLTVVEHPLGEHLLTTIRDSRCHTGDFGRAARLLATFLLWEASRSLSTLEAEIPGFDGSPVQVRKLANAPAGVSILRAGEAFSGPFRQMFPDAPLFHIDIKRDEATLRHHIYRDTLPNLRSNRPVLILDPMLATGGSVKVVLERVRALGADPVSVIALVSAPLGVQAVLNADAGVRVYSAALDDCLNEQGYIIPGLGDAGDRYFGTDE